MDVQGLMTDVVFGLCKPIFAYENKKRVLVGSCSFLKLGDEGFLITARHVLETRGDGPLFVGTRKGPLSLVRGYYKSHLSPVADDKFDIAVYPLIEDDLERLEDDALFIVKDMIIDTTLSQHPACVLGYPSSKNKGLFAKDEPILVQTHGIQTNVVEASAVLLQRHGANAEANFFLNFSRPDGEPQLFSPKGMSGGLVIGGHSASSSKVLGMPIELSKDGKLILCTHYKVIYNTVERLQSKVGRVDK